MPFTPPPETVAASAIAEPVAAPSASGIDAREVIARQIYAVSRLTPVMMLVNIVCAVATVLVLRRAGLADGWVLTWALLLIAAALFMLVKWLRLRHRPFPERMSRRTLDRTIASCALMGVFWAIPGLVYLPQTEGATEALLIVIAAGMVSGGSMCLYPIPMATYLFAGIVAAAHVVGLLLSSHGDVWPFLIVTVVYFYTVRAAVQRHQAIFVSEFVARRELARKNAAIEALLEESRSQTWQERGRGAARLERAQRLETVSQLTAGVAHDFNNLLAGIQGNAELLELEGRADRGLLASILEATARGANLTASLLTFASKRQLAPRTLRIDQSMTLSPGVLQQTLGPEIRVETRLAPDLWAVEVDPALLEQVVLNLAVNARDAMPAGGRFCIAADNHALPAAVDELPPGDYVRLRVTDTGAGMSEEVLEHAFEPFYTTKPFGRSSGLGLSMVYGFLQQSGGHVSIDSTPGEGTTVEILLPRAAGAATEAPAPDDAVEAGSGESVLLIENDAQVMRSVAQMLRSLNYRVVEAPDSDTARRILRGATPLDLVLSDLRLGGGTSGPDLAAEMQEAGVGPPFAFITGSAEGVAEARNRLPVLAKPFYRAELSVFLRCVLGGHRATDGEPAQDPSPGPDGAPAQARNTSCSATTKRSTRASPRR